MKKYIILPAILLIIILCSFIQVGGWIKYTSVEGRYSISFPEKPNENTTDNKTDDSIPFKLHSATYAPSNDEAYIAAWCDMTTFYPKEGTVKEMLENMRDGITESMKATHVTTLNTNVGDEPYIEFTFVTDEYTCKDRIYFINKVQYSILAIFSIKTGLPPSADKFISSFKVNKG